jgi:plasmid stabilization system protein ParE
MNVEYSKRAVADLHEIAANSRRMFGDRVAAGLEARIRKIMEQIRQAPESAPQVIERLGVRVVLLIRYPYKIFYRILGDAIRILHIRHTARQASNESGE